MTDTLTRTDVWALVVQPDYTVTRVTGADGRGLVGLDIAHSVLLDPGHAGPPLDVFTLAADRTHVGAVRGFSTRDGEPPNGLAWLTYGRSMLHGTVVLFHDPDEDYATEVQTPVPVDPYLVEFVEGAAALLTAGARTIDELVTVIRQGGLGAVIALAAP